MITTTDSTLLNSFEIDPAATQFDGAYDIALHDEGAHAIDFDGYFYESLWDSIQFIVFKFPRKLCPKEFDLANTDIGDWIALFQTAGSSVQETAIDKVLRMPKPRLHDDPEYRYQDCLYFLIAWVTMDDGVEIASLVKDGHQPELDFFDVSSLGAPAGPVLGHRTLLIGIVVKHTGPAVPWASLEVSTEAP